MSFHKLLLATGSTPKKLDVSGSDSENLYYLRSLEDARKIDGAARGGRRALLVGASFIGMEVASSLRNRDLDVSVVEQQKIPMQVAFGDRIGSRFRLVRNFASSAPPPI